MIAEQPHIYHSWLHMEHEAFESCKQSEAQQMQYLQNTTQQLAHAYDNAVRAQQVAVDRADHLKPVADQFPHLVQQGQQREHRLRAIENERNAKTTPSWQQ